VSSTFITYVADRVWVYANGWDGNGEPVCEMMQPTFGYITEYE
jgi:hypothetical protein